MPVYVYRGGRMVDKETGAPMVTGDWRPTVPQVVSPIAPYESPIDGTLITDRRQERDHMARHGVHHAADDRKPRKFKNRRFVAKHGLWDRAEV